MRTSPCPDERLVAAIHQGLLPNRFPARRDVEAAGAVRAGSAYDVFWPDADRLALVAYRARTQTLAGALAMTAFRQLFRASAPLARSAEEAVETALGALADVHDGVEMDLAAVLLDLPAREPTFSSRGEAYAGPLPDAEETGARLGAILGSAEPILLPLDGDDGLERELKRLVGAEPGVSAFAALSILPKTSDPGDLVFVVDSQAAAIAPILCQLEERCAKAGMDEATTGLLSLVIDEMASNVVSYAYGDGQAHEIVLRIHLQDGRAKVSIEDDGRPFDPLEAPAPDLSAEVDDRPLGGLGVHFLRSVAADIAYERRRGWNVLSFAVGPPSLSNPS